MAVASSIIEKEPTIARKPAIKYDIIEEGPERAKANDGKMNNPELIMAPTARENTPTKLI
jgi:hypothetical protein